MRRILVVLLGLPLLAACANKPGTSESAAGDGGNASCVAPYLNDQPPTGSYKSRARTVRPGQTITVYGHWYTATCNDTGSHSQLKPLPPVKLTLILPGGKIEHLGRRRAGGRDMGFSIRVRIPNHTEQGAAKVTDDRKPFPATYKFQVVPV